MKEIFLFPGQGAQQQGMGRDFPNSDAVWKEANGILGQDLKSIVYEGTQEELKKTSVTQPAVYVTEVIIMKHLFSVGIRPQAAAGHSLGEYAAVVASGAMDWKQGLELVKFRGRVFEEVGRARPGGMIAVVGMGLEKLSEITAEFDYVCEVVNFNSPSQYVLSTQREKLSETARKIKKAGAKMAIPLKVSGGFHSSLMDEAVGPMKEKIEKLDIKNPEIDFYSNATGRKAETSEEIRDVLIKQVNSPVKWTQIIENVLSEYGNDVRFIETGPGKVLRGLLRRIDRRAEVKGVSSPEDLEVTKGG